MPALTVQDIDARIESMRQVAKDVTRPVEDRRAARKVIDAYLDRHLQVCDKHG